MGEPWHWGEVPLRFPWLDPGVFDARSPSLPIRRWRNAASAAGRTSLSQHLDVFFPVKLCFSPIDSWVFSRKPPKEGPEAILKANGHEGLPGIYIYIYVIHICMVAAHLGLSKRNGWDPALFQNRVFRKVQRLSLTSSFPSIQMIKPTKYWRIPISTEKTKHRFLIHQLVVWHDAWIPNFNKLVVKSHTQAATIFPLNT